MLVNKSLRLLRSSISYIVHYNAGLFSIARFEAPLIATALFFVQINLLGEVGLERFLLSWLGVTILIWTIKSILKVDSVRIVHGKINGVLEQPAILSAQSQAAHRLIDFAADLMIIVTIMFIVKGDAGLLTMAGFALLVIVTQGAVNFSIFLCHLYMARWFDLKNTLVVIFIFFVIMSPIFFMFDDLDQFGNQYFTSFNPAAHFLAAYYNVFWFRVPVSLQVLPIVLILSASFILVYYFIIDSPATSKQIEKHTRVSRQKVLSLGRFKERGSITGLELFFNFYALGSHPMQNLSKKVRKLVAMQEFGDQLRRRLSTYSRLNDLYLDLLLASCLAGAEETQVSLPDEGILHVTEEQLDEILNQVNTIMGTKLSVIGGKFQMSDD